MRSSWLASAAKLRSRASLACRRASADSTWPSIRLNAVPSWPTSVRGSASGTRCGRSTRPLASGSSVTSAAVAVTRRSGRSDSRTHPVPISPVSTSAAENTAISVSSTCRMVLLTAASGRPLTYTVPSWPDTASSR